MPLAVVVTALLMSNAAVVRPATVAELKAGQSVGGLRFDTEDMVQDYKANKLIDKWERGYAKFETPETPGVLLDVTFNLPDKRVGESKRLRTWSDGTTVNVVALEPWWPEPAPHEYRAQAKLLGLEVGDFYAISKRFGALLKTDTPNLYVGLTTSTRAPNTLELRSVVLVRRADWLAPVAGSRTAPEIVKLVTDAIAQKDVPAARAAIPDPLPPGLAPDNEVVRAIASIDAFEAARYAYLRKGAEGDAAARIAALSATGRLMVQNYASQALKETCGIILSGLAQRLGADAEAMRGQDPLRASFLAAMASDAREANPPKAIGHNVGAIAVRFEIVYPAVARLASPDPAARAGALAKIRTTVASGGVAQETRRLYEVALAEGRERLLPEIARAAADAESKNLLATSAAYRLIEVALREKTIQGGEKRDWDTAAASSSDTPIGKAQISLARLARGLVPGIIPEPDSFYDPGTLRLLWERAMFTDDWPMHWADLTATPLDRQLETAGGCTVATANQRFSGRSTSTTETTTGGSSYGTWTYTQADVEAWEREVASLQSSIAAHESAAQYSDKPLGTEVRGAAGEKVVRQEVDDHGNVLGSSVIAESHQNVYRVGVGKAAQAEMDRINGAKASLSAERPRLERLLKSKPVVGQTWTGTKQVSGTTTSVRQEVTGTFRRTFLLTCADGNYQADEVSPVKEVLWKAEGFDHTLNSDEQIAQSLDRSQFGLGLVMGKAVAGRGVKAVAGLEGVGAEERSREAAWIRFLFGVDEPPPVPVEEIFDGSSPFEPLSDHLPEGLIETKELPDKAFQWCHYSDRCRVRWIHEWMTWPRGFTTYAVWEIWDSFRDPSNAVAITAELYPWVIEKDKWPAFLKRIGKRGDLAAASKLSELTLGSTD